MDKFCEIANIDPSSATHDNPIAVSPCGNYSIEYAECLASCGTAPVCLINDDFHENVTADNAETLLEQYPPTVFEEDTEEEESSNEDQSDEAETLESADSTSETEDQEEGDEEQVDPSSELSEETEDSEQSETLDDTPAEEETQEESQDEAPSEEKTNN